MPRRPETGAGELVTRALELNLNPPNPREAAERLQKYLKSRQDFMEGLKKAKMVRRALLNEEVSI